MPPRDRIRLRNAVFYAHHGVAAAERDLGGQFEVDADLTGDFSAAIRTDNLARAVDYESVYALIRNTVVSRKYRLLEALGGAIADSILKEFSQVESVTIRVRKSQPPVKGVVGSAEVEITRDRAGIWAARTLPRKAKR
jgi:dihydroneopterin aldolase